MIELSEIAEAHRKELVNQIKHSDTKDKAMKVVEQSAYFTCSFILDIMMSLDIHNMMTKEDRAKILSELVGTHTTAFESLIDFIGGDTYKKNVANHKAKNILNNLSK